MRWIVGDIHGMFRALDALINRIEQRDSAAQFIFVGDYVNRGPDSPKVIERLLHLPNAKFLRGNHDDILDLILHDKCHARHHAVPDGVMAFCWFMQHGLEQTLVAYGADAAELEYLATHPHPAKIRKAMEVIPPRHRQFISELQSVVEYPDIFVTHAFWDPDETDTSPDISERLAAKPALRYQNLWGRFTTEQIRRPKRWSRTGYFGHTPVQNYLATETLEPLRGPRIVLVDTAAALVTYGRLSAVCAETGEVLQVDRAGKIPVNGVR